MIVTHTRQAIAVFVPLGCRPIRPELLASLCSVPFIVQADCLLLQRENGSIEGACPASLEILLDQRRMKIDSGNNVLASCLKPKYELQVPDFFFMQAWKLGAGCFVANWVSFLSYVR